MLETFEDVVPQLQRLAQILQSERVPANAVVAVVVRLAAGRDDEIVVRQVRAVGECDVLLGEVEAGDLALAIAHVRHTTEHLPQRRRDLRRVQQAARDLVEQRREQVVVAGVDEQDVDGLVPQGFRALQSTEATTDDDDPGKRTHGAKRTRGRARYTSCPADGPRRAPARSGLTRGCVASISRIEVGEASRRRRNVVKESAKTNTRQ